MVSTSGFILKGAGKEWRILNRIVFLLKRHWDHCSFTCNCKKWHREIYLCFSQFPPVFPCNTEAQFCARDYQHGHKISTARISHVALQKHTQPPSLQINEQFWDTERSCLLSGQEQIGGDQEWVQGEKWRQYCRQDKTTARSAAAGRGDVSKVAAFMRHLGGSVD